jgi:hypothetical protein
VAQDDDMTRLDLPSGCGVGDGFGVIKTNGLTAELRWLGVADFEDDAIWGQVTKADLHVCVVFER